MYNDAKVKPIFQLTKINSHTLPIMTNFNKVFKLHSLLGKGGQGSVSKMYIPTTTANTAIKQIQNPTQLPTQPPTQLQNLIQPPTLIQTPNPTKFYAVKQSPVSDITTHLNEISALQECSSPYIIKFYDYFLIKPCTFVIVLEYIPGYNLSQYIISMKSMKLKSSQTMIYSFTYWLFSTLSFIHSKNFAHRDIKPDNIMVDTHQNKFVLIDFGLACKVATNNNRNNNRNNNINGIAGTPRYIAPDIWEQNKAKLWMKGDIWSAGITLYNLVEQSFPSGDHMYINEVCLYCNDAFVLDVLRYCLVKDPSLRKEAWEVLCLINGQDVGTRKKIELWLKSRLFGN